jgi:DNA-binding transcriptional MerR regulator
MLRIGEFARLTRVSVRMLRHYDRIGLLTPARADARTGYRYYRAAQLQSLNRIVQLRELGFSLREIAIVMHGDDAPYERREQDLLAQLDMTNRQLGAVRARRTLRAVGADVVVRPVPTARMATLRAGRGAQVETLFYVLEQYVSSSRARADRPPMTLLDRGVVTVAVPLSRPVPETRLAAGDVRVETLPAIATMACTIHNGPYGGLADHRRHMLEWLALTGRRPDGPLRAVYLRFGAEPELRVPPTYLVDDADPGYVTELQLPVR